MEQRNPTPTVDIIIEFGTGIVLIERRNEPRGWALPGGFIDYGERVEIAAIREAYEETGLSVVLRDLLGVYSDPERDPRGHTMSTVYVAIGSGTLKAGDDAKSTQIVDPANIQGPLCFDHAAIIADYLNFCASGKTPAPRAEFTRQEKRSLLAIARQALKNAVSGNAYHPPSENPGRLDHPGACFVTLRKLGDLRGCIGVMSADKSLARVVGAMAEAAALRDTRFLPVRPDELSSIDIEISVLGPSVPIKGTQDIRIGVHGLMISKGYHRGVLLPQVAKDHQWDSETFLKQTCIKAGLPPYAWNEPGTEIEAFTAEIIEEGDFAIEERAEVTPRWDAKN